MKKNFLATQRLADSTPCPIKHHPLFAALSMKDEGGIYIQGIENFQGSHADRDICRFVGFEIF